MRRGVELRLRMPPEAKGGQDLLEVFTKGLVSFKFGKQWHLFSSSSDNSKQNIIQKREVILEEAEAISNVFDAFSKDARLFRNWHRSFCKRGWGIADKPVWKTSSRPPDPHASRLIKARISWAHMCWVMNPWLPYKDG